MSEIRQDPTTGEWVIIAGERARRPSDYARMENKPEPDKFELHCPFCPGNESLTPPDVLKYINDQNQHWNVRAFANQFPALTPTESGVIRENNDFFISMVGKGVHEVIVETPIHNRQLALMDDLGVFNVLLAYQERYSELIQLPFVKSVVIFKNHGPAAGTSLEHPHSQVIAIPIVPRHFRVRHEVAIRYYDTNGRSLYSDLLRYEIDEGKRLVLDDELYTAFHPFASRGPFETWIVPKNLQASFQHVSAESLKNLAHVLRAILHKLYYGLNNPDYNLVIDSAPSGDENNHYYTWHLRIIPRMVETAGFEIGSGIHINPAIPEETAQFMRNTTI